MEKYCCRGNEPLLTKILIENSNEYFSKSFLNNFVKKFEWVDGLDQWTNQSNTNISHFNQNQFDFHQDIGIYLPKQQHISRSSTDLIQPSAFNNKFNSNQRQCSSENNCRKVRISHRIIQSNKQNNLNNEHFIKRQTNPIQSKRIPIKIPSINIKHQHFTSKSVQQQTDSTLINNKYSNIYSPSSFYTNHDLQRQSPLVLQQITTFGLTITPLEISQSNQKTIPRPTTQLELNSIDNCQTNSFCSSGLTSSTNILFSIQNTFNQTTKINRHHRSKRSNSKNEFQRANTFHLLPNLSTKSFSTFISNQNNS